MQRQHQRLSQTEHQADQEGETQGTTLRKPARWGGRSWGEMLTGWMLVLWGFFWGLLGLATLSIPENPRLGLLGIVFHAGGCLIGGGLTLLRARSLGAWFLRIAAIALLVAGAVIICEPDSAQPRWHLDFAVFSLLFFLGFAFFSGCFLFLARWLSRLDDE